MDIRRQLSALLLMLPLAAFAVPYAPGAASDASIVPGRDYIELAAPLPVSTGHKMEVREFFFYGCSHCFDLEPAVNGWLKRKPADVALVRTPAVFNAKWEVLARAYYVAEELKMVEKIHAPLYSAIHVKHEKFDSQEALGKFFVRMGATQEQFDIAWRSTKVNLSVKNAEALSRKYMVQGTPTLTVNGKYVVPAAGERTFAIVDFLLGKERVARAGK